MANYGFVRKKAAIWFGALAIVAGALAMFGGQAYAKSGYLTSFNSQNGTSGAALDTCNVCHTAVPTRNPYGTAYGNAGHSFAAIENADSDGDGFTNIAEITARTFPGDPASKPATTLPPPPPPTDTTTPTMDSTNPVTGATAVPVATIDTSSTAGTRLMGVAAMADTDASLNQTGKPAGFEFGNGVIAFNVAGLAPGGTASVVLTFQGGHSWQWGTLLILSTRKPGVSPLMGRSVPHCDQGCPLKALAPYSSSSPQPADLRITNP